MRKIIHKLFHFWKYTDKCSVRVCVYCGKNQVLMNTGDANNTSYWHTVYPEKHVQYEALKGDYVENYFGNGGEWVKVSYLKYLQLKKNGYKVRKTSV